MRLKVFLAASALLCAAGATSAATIDFTDPNAYDTQTSSEASGTFFGGTWTITGDPSDSLTYTDYDGPTGATGGLAEKIDGIGVVDDEVTSPSEFLHLEFSSTTQVTGLHFLDLFFSNPDDESTIESVLVWFDGRSGAADDADLELFAVDVFQTMGGYAFFSIDFTGTKLTFGAGSGNEVSNPDFALAAVNVIPLPAAGWLLLGGIGGLAALKRRKKA